MRKFELATSMLFLSLLPGGAQAFDAMSTATAIQKARRLLPPSVQGRDYSRIQGVRDQNGSPGQELCYLETYALGNPDPAADVGFELRDGNQLIRTVLTHQEDCQDQQRRRIPCHRFFNQDSHDRMDSEYSNLVKESYWTGLSRYSASRWVFYTERLGIVRTPQGVKVFISKHDPSDGHPEHLACWFDVQE